MDKAAKVACLSGRLQQLNNLAYQLTMYLRSKGYMIEVEKQQAIWLVDAINALQKEGRQASSESVKEGLVKRMER